MKYQKYTITINEEQRALIQSALDLAAEESNNLAEVEEMELMIQMLDKANFELDLVNDFTA